MQHPLFGAGLGMLSQGGDPRGIIQGVSWSQSLRDQMLQQKLQEQQNLRAEEQMRLQQLSEDRNAAHQQRAWDQELKKYDFSTKMQTDKFNFQREKEAADSERAQAYLNLQRQQNDLSVQQANEERARQAEVDRRAIAQEQAAQAAEAHRAAVMGQVQGVMQKGGDPRGMAQSLIGTTAADPEMLRSMFPSLAGPAFKPDPQPKAPSPMEQERYNWYTQQPPDEQSKYWQRQQDPLASIIENVMKQGGGTGAEEMKLRQLAAEAKAQGSDPAEIDKRLNEALRRLRSSGGF